jgi:hypothetical protein
MLLNRTITVYPNERGKTIYLQNVHKVELEIVPGGSGYSYSGATTAYIGFVVQPSMTKMTVFPGWGGLPGKKGQRSYVVVAPNQLESVESRDGSGIECAGIDGYVIVSLLMDMPSEPLN